MKLATALDEFKDNDLATLELECERVRILCSILETSRKAGTVDNSEYEKLSAVQNKIFSLRNNQPFWESICKLELSLMEADVLACMLAPELDPAVGWAYQRLQSTNSNFPSAALLIDLLCIDLRVLGEFYKVFERGSSLLNENLIKHEEFELYSPLRLMPGVVQLFLGNDNSAIELPGATLVDEEYSWGDLILPADRVQMLQEYLNWIKYKSTVIEQWQGKKSGGPIALFSGPSGTGKTLAASIIASEIGRPLYKVDLGRLVSKYIGETEKNLNSLFDTAECRDVVLLFDEADSLFGKRGDIKESKDRYSNLEVSHLLSRLETISTPCILTTNIRKNIDSAFLRRFQVVVEFPRPDANSRKNIWGKSLPPKAPISSEIDLSVLAKISNFNGGNIKNAALNAAYLAAADATQIEYKHLATAVWREMAKDGRELLDSDLGPLKEYLEGGLN